MLHQQAIHGPALALRLVPGDVEAVEAEVVHCRGLAETEDHVTAAITLSGRATVHELVLHLADGHRLNVRGRNLEAGLGEIAVAPTHEELRRAMYAAVLDAADGRPIPPCLFPLTTLRRPLEVIDRVYRDARVVRTAHAVAA